MKKALCLLATVLVLAGCTTSRKSPSPQPSTDLSAPPERIATSVGPFSGGPVAPPVTGALLGAWVRPPALTQAQRIAAVRGFQDTLGRRLDIVHTYKRLDEPFFTESDVANGTTATLMLSWAGGDSRSVTLGKHDALIRQRARQIRSFGRPVLLRYRWEMDRPNLAPSVWSAEDYVAGWRHVRTLFAEEGARNVSWVWCPTVEGFAGGSAPAYYPGDDSVDWTCVDVYAGARFRPMGELLRPFLSWAAQHPSKPIMIGEFGVARAWGAQRAAWLRNASAVFQANPQIKAVLYFESDPDGNGADQQFRLADDPDALAAFVQIAREPYYNSRKPAG